MRNLVDVIISDQRWTDTTDEDDWPSIAEKAIQASLDTLNWEKPVELSLTLTNDAHIQELNRAYRHKNAPTNSLSFPLFENFEFFSPKKRNNEPLLLGDILLSFDTIKKEAEEQKKEFLHHATHLIIHGFLHLLGYDHQIEEEAKKMESLEINILHELTIGNPYQ